MSRTLGRGFAPGDEIIVTRMDHEGNVSPWLQLAEDRGLTVRFLPFDTTTWQVEEDDLKKLLGERTKLVALNYASNLTGSINPVKRLVRLAKEAGALTYIDAVQFAPHGLVDVEDIGCDFLACSAYKFFGPHMGILWGRRAVIEGLDPYKCRCSSNDLPERFELGTPQIELMAGLSAAVGYFEGSAPHRCGRFAPRQDRCGVRRFDRLRGAAGAEADRRPVGRSTGSPSTASPIRRALATACRPSPSPLRASSRKRWCASSTPKTSSSGPGTTMPGRSSTSLAFRPMKACPHRRGALQHTGRDRRDGRGRAAAGGDAQAERGQLSFFGGRVDSRCEFVRRVGRAAFEPRRHTSRGNERIFEMRKIGFALLAAALCGGTPGFGFGGKLSKTGYADINGLHMYYEVRGEGQPTLVLHGAYMSAESMGRSSELSSRAGDRHGSAGAWPHRRHRSSASPMSRWPMMRRR